MYGSQDYNKFPKRILDHGKFPLWSGRDIRTVSGSGDPLTNYNNKPGFGDTAAFGVAFHLHNWFQDFENVRHKYATYAHGSETAKIIPLSEIEGDIDVLVRCARDFPNDLNPGGKKYYEHNGDIESFWKNFGGPKPLYFRNETYVYERHAALQSMVADDERKYGSKYAANLTAP